MTSYLEGLPTTSNSADALLFDCLVTTVEVFEETNELPKPSVSSYVSLTVLVPIIPTAGSGTVFTSRTLTLRLGVAGLWKWIDVWLRSPFEFPSVLGLNVDIGDFGCSAFFLAAE